MKAVLFDMDGLVLDTEKEYQEAWYEAITKYCEASKDDYLAFRSCAKKYAIPLLREKYGDKVDYYELRKEKNRLLEKRFEKNGIKKKQYVDELLEFLKQNDIRRILVTATDIERAKKYLKETKLIEEFDEIISASMVEDGKPDPDVYLYALERAGLQKDECIALEDSPNGVMAASKAGLRVIMIPDLSDPDEETRERVFAVCKDLSEARSVIEATLKV